MIGRHAEFPLRGDNFETVTDPALASVVQHCALMGERRHLMKVGIAIDDWKRPTFERILSASGFDYEVFPGVTSDTLLIRVMCDEKDLDRLHETVQKCQNKAAELKN